MVTTVRAAEKAAIYSVKAIEDALNTLSTNTAFFVRMRAYHGWHRGLTPTQNLKAIQKIIAEKIVPTRRGNVAFNWSNAIGSRMDNCFDHRLNQTLLVHLTNTLRKTPDTGIDREKMVDTSLACDVLVDARSNPTGIRLILGEDDDHVPAAFTAEFWSKDKGGRTIIVRKREPNSHQDLSGVYHKIGAIDA